MLPKWFCPISRLNYFGTIINILLLPFQDSPTLILKSSGPLNTLQAGWNVFTIRRNLDCLKDTYLAR
jgi:hypothetical protein